MPHRVTGKNSRVVRRHKTGRTGLDQNHYWCFQEERPEDMGSIPGLGRSPGGGHGNPLQYSCLENPHGQRSLAGCMGLKKVRCS